MENYSKMSEGRKLQYCVERYCDLLNEGNDLSSITVDAGIRTTVEFLIEEKELIATDEEIEEIVEECIGFYEEDVRKEADSINQGIIQTFYKRGGFAGGNYFTVFFNIGRYEELYTLELEGLDEDDPDLEESSTEEICRKRTEHTFSYINSKYVGDQLKRFCETEKMNIPAWS